MENQKPNCFKYGKKVIKETFSGISTIDILIFVTISLMLFFGTQSLPLGTLLFSLLFGMMFSIGYFTLLRKNTQKTQNAVT